MTENSSEQPKLSKAKGCLRIIGITVYSIIYIPLIIVGMTALMGERRGYVGGDDTFSMYRQCFGY